MPSRPTSPRRSTDSSESPSSLSSNRLQFPFPQQDWTRRPSSSQSARYQSTRRGSTASSIHSIGGALDTSSQRHIGPADSAIAISTLLQPPIVRTGLLPYTSAPSAVKTPSTRDIPPVTLTNVPHVEPSAFKPYLSQVGSLYDAFQRAKLDSDNVAAQLFRRDSKRDEFTEILERRLKDQQPGRRPSSRQESISSLSPVDSPRRRSSAGASRRHPSAVTPLTTIPDVYFQEDFHLENPRTFDVVSERSEVIQQPQGTDGSKDANGSAEAPAPPKRKALATNAILQEKLSWYMDTVEIHLISSISTASTSFFAALGSLRELQSQAADSVARIQSLREDLNRLDRDMAIGGLKIVGMKRRRENLRKLSEAVDQLRAVVDGVAHCEDLIEDGKLEDALDRLDMLELLVSGELMITGSDDQEWLPTYLPRDLIDLRGLNALDGFSDGMMQLRARVGKGFESRFLEALMGDLRRHIKGVPSQDTLQRWASASLRTRGDSRPPTALPAYHKMEEGFRSNMLAILNGLSRSNHTPVAAAAYRDAVTREMKVLIRQHLPSSTDDDAESTISSSTRASSRTSQQEKSSILARNLRSLDWEDAEQLFVNIYTNVGEALRRLSTQTKVLLDVSSGTAISPGIRSPPKSPNIANMDGYLSRPISDVPAQNSHLQEELMQSLDMSSLLGQSVDAAQSQITKILKVRGEQSVRLPLQRFLRYFLINRLFADECEAVSGRSGAALKGVVDSQIKQFVTTMGQSENQTLRQTMDADKWEAKDFGDHETEVLTRILEAMHTDPPEWTKSKMIWESVPTTPANETQGTNGETNGTAKARNAVINEEKYVLVNCAMFALDGINRFENLIAVIPSITSEVAVTLVDYLRTFQSRTCQLILGAGAKESAGLKSITTKHLALASQALNFIIALIPYLREFIRRHSSSTSLAELDKMRRLYQDQQTNIHDKLIEIMTQRLHIHVNAMRKLDFDAVADQQVSQHMETLTRETNTFHRTLSRHLPEPSVRSIITPVFASYREQWGKAFRETLVRTGAGKARLLRDAELFETKLNKIDGFGDIGTFMTDIVKEKVVEAGATTEAGK
ncbi:Vacuolar protein sorting-associated protein 54 [Lasiodiplodia hormozganensis]|uniref:Vacuolar protein sorting-associated protein 54 n=1 Tax=Lasiodiplodia hormozganensis TaxID=869390 RepID=A0AA39Z2X3_9PEZI|nr:Vacuolar protein sorting-associated protein 54 [Lasiodiplodia hormozganensis]